jgi:hypothetical protein
MASAVVVARSNADRLEYLAEGLKDWTDDGRLALRFETVREATRTAMRLPSRLRAFALPVHSAA